MNLLIMGLAGGLLGLMAYTFFHGTMSGTELLGGFIGIGIGIAFVGLFVFLSGR
jgi:hypothetical protein